MATPRNENCTLTTLIGSPTWPDWLGSDPDYHAVCDDLSLNPESESTLRTIYDMGISCLRNQPDTSMKYFQLVWAERRKQLSPADESTQQVMSSMLTFLQVRGKERKHGELLWFFVNFLAVELGWEYPLILTLMSRLVTTFLSLNEVEKAAKVAEEAVRISTTHKYSDQCSIDAVQALAKVRISQGRYREAENDLRKILATSKARYGLNCNIFNIQGELAYTLIWMGKEEESEKLLKEAISNTCGNPANHATFNVEVPRHFGALCERQGRFHEAEELYKQAWRVSEARLGKLHCMTLDCLGHIASVLICQHKIGEAERYYEERDRRLSDRE